MIPAVQSIKKKTKKNTAGISRLSSLLYNLLLIQLSVLISKGMCGTVGCKEEKIEEEITDSG